QISWTQQVALPWDYQNLSIVPNILAAQNIIFSYEQKERSFQILWKFPGKQSASYTSPMTLNELQQAVEELLHEERQLELQLKYPARVLDKTSPRSIWRTILSRWLGKSRRSTQEYSTEQAYHLLIPHVHELERHVRILIERSQAITQLEEIDS